jgi:alpha,alpha-trehalase
VLDPLWPEAIGKLTFPLRYRGQRFAPGSRWAATKIDSDTEQTNASGIEYRRRVQRLKPGHTIEFS